MGLTRWDSRPDGFQLAGIEGAYFALPNRSAIASFESRYTAAYGAAPIRWPRWPLTAWPRSVRWWVRAETTRSAPQP